MTVKSRLARKRRQRTVRMKVTGTPARPRLNVYRSLNNIYAQVIDDEAGKTLVSASTIDRKLATELEGKDKVNQAKVVGEAVAERALEAGIVEVVFDRGGFLYHGRIKALADSARKSGLTF